MKRTRKNYFASFLILLFIGLAIWMIYSYASHNFIYDLFQNDASGIVEYLEKYNDFSYLVFVLLIVVEAVFAPFPPLILYVAGGLLFGWFIGGLLALLGNFIGAAAAFQISRHFARDFMKKKISKNMMKKFDSFSKKYGTLSIFVLRINPLTSSDLFSYIAGLTKMNFWKFLASTTIALAPIIFVQTFLGESIQDNPIISLILIVGGLIYIAGFFIFYFWLRKTKRKSFKQKINKLIK